MTATHSSFDIQYGFLTGNLFSGWSTEELESINADQTIAAFSAAVKEKLAVEFPGAHISIVFEHAEGVVPNSCRTWCIDLKDPDFDHNRTCEAIEYFAAEVFEAGNWIIPND